LCVGDLVWLVLSGTRFAGWSTTSACKTSTTQHLRFPVYTFLLFPQPNYIFIC